MAGVQIKASPEVDTSQASSGRTSTAVALRDVQHSYRAAGSQVAVLDGVDLAVHGGEFVAVVGRSGSGKSTLLHVAGGLITPERGSVTVADADLGSMDANRRAELRRRTVGFVFQFFHLLPHLDVRDNVALPLLLDGVRSREARDRASSVLDAVELGDRATHLPSELSGGQLQRAAIARALVATPSVVLADEPTGNLDATTAAGVLDLLVSQVRDRGVALILVTHDAGATERADRTLELVDGRLRP